ncbi:MAG: helicase-exonuclease AddAB subunit AddA [Lachnospiraceae bacterium]
MGVTWTEDQKKVIELRNRNILVSAAAGSGKTAVLVERIMEMVCDETKPVDIDHLLVVTFTRAAAAEMKERVGNAIRKKLEEQPDNGYLQKQETLVHHAQITTIDSFCTYILRNHFGEIDLDPAFRVADEGELKLLRQDIIKEILEEAYQAEDPEFLNFVECFAHGKNDRILEEVVLKIYEFSTSDPFPMEWLEKIADETTEDWKKHFREHLKWVIADLLKKNEFLIRICQEPDGPVHYEDALQEDRLLLRGLEQCRTYGEYSGLIRGRTYQALSRKKMPSGTSPEKAEFVKEQRNEIKKELAKLEKQYFYASQEMIEHAEKLASPVKKELIRLTMRFSERYAASKKKRNIVDFSDMEHLALRVLVKKEGDSYVPTAAAEGYADYYEEIMIDEYQDSNMVQELLLTSISKKCRGQNNLFMVGDVKQSIYRFRQARPELFMEKQETYTMTDSPCQRINLSKNFRSRPEVLESVNDLFYRIMKKQLGNVEYDSQSALYPGAAMAAGEPGEFQTELLLLDIPGDDDMTEELQDRKELEAAMVAQRILEFMKEGRVTDKKSGELRPVQYGDIVILLRTMSGWSDSFSNVLGAYGIPVVSGSSTGYFSATEVQTILNYLKVLDNRKQDIPLSAVLNSPIGNLNSGELAVIRSAYPETVYHEACLRYAQEGNDLKIRKKLSEFYEMTDDLRKQAEYLPIHELLWEIYEKTYYDRIVRLQPNGEVRYANLQMLVQKALDFETTSYRGLFNFVRYIESLQKYEVDYGMAEVSMGNENAVHIMSIHKSKGLEFPIVFAAGMAKRFNKQDARERIAMHPVFGVGIDAVDAELRTKIPTLQKKAIQRCIELESLGEELRVLYVAMTRAKDHLVLTAALKDAKKEYERILNESWKQTDCSYEKLCSAGSYLDWIMEPWCREDAPVLKKIVPLEQLVTLEVEKQLKEVCNNVVLREQKREYTRELKEKFDYEYPYLAEAALPGKVSVSELKKTDWTTQDGEDMFEEEEIIPYVPAFLKGERRISATDRGTAYHKVMECMDLNGIHHSRQVEEQMEKLTKQGKIAPDVIPSIRPYDIFRFCQTSLAKRMLAAEVRGQLFREQSFVIAKPASEIYPDCDSNQDILIQGVVDVYFEEDDGLVLADYKTDNIRSAQELKNLYRKQLNLYAQALEQLTGKKVKERWIYSFTIGKEILV